MLEKNEFIEKIKSELDSMINNELCKLSNFNKGEAIIFISHSDGEVRAKVWNTSPQNYEQAIKKTCGYLSKIHDQKNIFPRFIKVDIVYNIEKIIFSDLLLEIKSEKLNNYYKNGISFDENFSIAILEQEIYGNSIINGKIWDQPSTFLEENLNKYLKLKYNISKRKKLKNDDKIILFKTKSLFYEDTRTIHLNNEYINNGIRLVENKDLKAHSLELIEKNSKYLYSQIDSSTGKFIYGYIPAMNEKLTNYNSIRHCTSLYSLLEVFEISDKFIALDKLEKGINYTIENLIKFNNKKTSAFVIENNNHEMEIKLGANAAAILMFTKYMEITKSDKYLLITEKLANGILDMIKKDGSTIHIINYPSLEIKEEFRVIYYDGEAALSLLRLYQINNDPKLLRTVELMYENFIEKDYWKHNDHWLSYCTNELSLISPKSKYIEFGIKNYIPYLKRYKFRRTARGTFLEMLMASYKMVTRLNYEDNIELLKNSKFDELCDVINTRVEYQRVVGFFYPELAIYFKKPNIIMNSFFVRQENFRTRIDDNEHNLSGYIAYYLHFKNIQKTVA